MLTDTRVMASIAVSDLKTSSRFYTNTLGLKVQDEPMEGTVVLSAGDRTNLQLYQKDDVRPSENTCATFEVPDIGSEVSALERAGISFEHYDLPGAKAQGSTVLLGAHRAAWFKDPDGNILCIHQNG